MTSAKRFPSASMAENLFDRWGRRLKCVVCGDKLRHPDNGRPRICCARERCQHMWRRQRNAAKFGVRATYVSSDFDEACALWSGCFRCRKGGGVLVRSTRFKVLPACEDCRTKPLTGWARDWVKRCSPGCPLPNPFAMFPKEAAK